MSTPSKKLAGDAASLARDSGLPELERCKRNLEDALTAGSKLIDDAYKSIMVEVEQKLQMEYSSIQDSLKGVRAKLESDLRSRMSEKEKEFVEKVLSEVKARILSRKKEDWYRDFMDKIFAKLAEEARNVGGLTVWVSSDDLELARELIQKHGNPPIKIANEPASITGGVVAVDASGSINIDYSIDTILQVSTLKLQSLILKALREARVSK